MFCSNFEKWMHVMDKNKMSFSIRDILFFCGFRYELFLIYITVIVMFLKISLS